MEKKNVRTTLLGDVEVSIVYFRAGYGPNDYPTEIEWQARDLIESSLAIKCPTVAQQLAGTKKVQQVLGGIGKLERFFLDQPETSSLLRNCFTGLFSLDPDTEEGQTAYTMALTNPERYVLKPQREGGGNNLYGFDMVEALQNMPERDRAAYILMELIQSPTLQNILVKSGTILHSQVISELGVYGIWCAEGETVHVNRSGGHLLRTKTADTKEGGVAAGFAALDSPLLY